MPSIRFAILVAVLTIHTPLPGQNTRLQASFLEGRQLERRGDYVQARERFTAALREAEKLEPVSVQVAAILDSLGTVCEQRGQFVDAEIYFKRSLRMLQDLRGPDHSATLTVLGHLGALYLQSDRVTKAEPLLRRVLEIRMQEWGPDNERTAELLNQHGILFAMAGRYDEAESFYHQALTIYEARLGPDHIQVSAVLGNLGHLAVKRQRNQEALEYAQRSVRILEGITDPPQASWANTRWVLGAAYARTGQLAVAEASLRDAVAMAQDSFGPESPRTAHFMQDHAAVLRQLNRKGEAKRLESAAVRILTNTAKATGTAYSSMRRRPFGRSNSVLQACEQGVAKPTPPCLPTWP